MSKTPTYEERLRDITARAEADLAMALCDEGLDIEVEPSLLAFRREAYAYFVAIRNPRMQSQQRLAEYDALTEYERHQERKPETDEDWLDDEATWSDDALTRLDDEWAWQVAEQAEDADGATDGGDNPQSLNSSSS